MLRVDPLILRVDPLMLRVKEINHSTSTLSQLDIINRAIGLQQLPVKLPGRLVR